MPSSLPKLFRTDELDATYATVLGFGPAGSGKTYSIRSCPKPLILATELGETKGFLSLQDLHMPFIPIDSHDDLVAVISELNSTFANGAPCQYQGEEFETIVLDSITHLGEMYLESFMKMKGWTDLHGMDARGKDPRQAYGYLSEKGRQAYKLLFSVRAHLYIIAREGLLQVGDGKEATYFPVPELPGQRLPRELPGWPDASVRLARKAGKHVILTTGEEGAPCRVRSPEGAPKLPSRCSQNIGALMRYMCGEHSAINELDPKRMAA
jgi:hypothetical protein